METLLDKTLINFGFPAALVLIMLWGFYKVVQWIMNQQALLIAQWTAEKTCLHAIIDRQTVALNQHTEQAKDFHNEVKTAHEFQRKEHEQLADILTGIGEAVGRINGYKGEH